MRKGREKGDREKKSPSLPYATRVRGEEKREGKGEKAPSPLPHERECTCAGKEGRQGKRRRGGETQKRCNRERERGGGGISSSRRKAGELERGERRRRGGEEKKERERERCRERARNDFSISRKEERRGSPHASPRDGNNFRHKKMQGEREGKNEDKGKRGGRRRR